MDDMLYFEQDGDIRAVAVHWLSFMRISIRLQAQISQQNHASPRESSSLLCDTFLYIKTARHQDIILLLLNRVQRQL